MAETAYGIVRVSRKNVTLSSRIRLENKQKSVGITPSKPTDIKRANDLYTHVAFVQ